MDDDVAGGRTFLFVPGHRKDQFGKAHEAGADVVIIDLEDAVGVEAKSQARDDTRQWLATGRRAVVRVNSIRTEWFEQDFAAVGALASAIMLPKAECAADMIEVAQSLGGRTPLIPLIETTKGVLNVTEICAVESVIRVALGNVDLAAQLGVDPSSHLALTSTRSALVHASAHTGRIPPIDGVTTAIGDEQALERDSAHAKEMGFGAKLCIHPSQIATVARTLEPTEDEVLWARGIIDYATDSVTSHNGTMIDPPVVARATRILEQAAPNSTAGEKRG